MYGFSITLTGDFDDIISKVTDELKKEGFGVLTDIDAKAVIKTKLDKDIRPYRILGACNPNYAHQAIEMEPDIGLLLPCNVVVRQEEDASITVSFIDPKAVFELVNRDEMAEISMTVKSHLERVRDALKGS